MSRLSEGVYWCARDLEVSPIGNHHFILLVCPNSAERFYGESILREDAPNGTTYFYTVGAFKGVGENPKLLKMVVNQQTDVQAVREYLDPDEHTSLLLPDYDLEPHLVTPPSGSIENFIATVIQLAINYKANGNIEYSLIDENCAAWVNTLFKVAGVSETERKKRGEFFGIDAGEEDLIPEQFFMPFIRLKCLGHIPGPTFLDGRTADGTVALVSDTTLSGTKWKDYELGSGVVQLECLGHIPGPTFLDGRTADGTVALVSDTTLSGTKWRIIF
jgi:hypothetical protein